MKELRCYLFDRIRRKIVIVAMLISAMLLIVACSPDCDTSVFPTGRFSHEKHTQWVLEFDEEGKWQYFTSSPEIPTAVGRYSIDGDIYTEETHDTRHPKIPATYTWSYNCQKLTFTVIEDEIAARRKWYDGQTYIKVE